MVDIRGVMILRDSAIFTPPRTLTEALSLAAVESGLNWSPPGFGSPISIAIYSKFSVEIRSQAIYELRRWHKRDNRKCLTCIPILHLTSCLDNPDEPETGVIEKQCGNEPRTNGSLTY